MSQQHNVSNPNYNQSNNNELFDEEDEEDDDQHEEETRSAEKILDAFERFYLHRGKPSTVPMKVKYIPEDNNSNAKRSQYHSQDNTHRYRSTSRSHSSSSSSDSIYSRSPISSRRSIYDNNHRQAVSTRARFLSLSPFVFTGQGRVHISPSLDSVMIIAFVREAAKGR